jgi:hypothetical protein
MKTPDETVSDTVRPALEMTSRGGIAQSCSRRRQTSVWARGESIPLTDVLPQAPKSSCRWPRASPQLASQPQPEMAIRISSGRPCAPGLGRTQSPAEGRKNTAGGPGSRHLVPHQSDAKVYHTPVFCPHFPAFSTTWRRGPGLPKGVFGPLWRVGWRAGMRQRDQGCPRRPAVMGHVGTSRLRIRREESQPLVRLLQFRRPRPTQADSGHLK